VKKALFAVLLIACFVSVAVAADHQSYRAARPDVVAAGKVAVQHFVNVPETLAASEVIFTSDYDEDAVWWFNTKGKELGSITSGLSNPQGLATDSKNNLYVANTGASTYLVYAKPYTKSPKTVSVSGYYPVGISQFNNGQYVAVANIFATSGSNGAISLFKSGKLVATITDSDFFYYYFCAFDKTGNLFFDGRSSSGSVVVGEIAGAGKGKTTAVTLTTSNSIEFPGGVAVNTKNQILIDDQEGFAVYTYNQPKKGSLGSPVETTPLTGAGDPVNIALVSTDKDLWDADASTLTVNEFAYPKGGSAIDTITPSGAGLLIGVAVTPAEVP